MIRAVVLLSALLLGACGSDSGSAGNVRSGRIATFAGTGEQGLSAPGTPASETLLNFPVDLTFEPDGAPYVLDFNNHRVIRFDEEQRLEVVAGTGELGHGPEGPAIASLLVHPSGVAFDGQGGIIIAAWHNNKIKRVDPATGLLEDVCGDGRPATEALLDQPLGVAKAPNGDLYIADFRNHRIRVVYH